MKHGCKNFVQEMEIVNFDGRDPRDFRKQVREYSALLLTGGGDIHPSLYGNPDTEHLCQGIDIKRDELEYNMLEAALTCELPHISHLQGASGNKCISRRITDSAYSLLCPIKIPHKEQQDLYHQVLNQTGIHNCSGSQEPNKGMVNSSHHQAIDKLGSGLKITAFQCRWST